MNKTDIKEVLRTTQLIKEDEEETIIKATPSEYERIKTLLDNDKINHAGIIRELWGSGGSTEATKRSLFGKKLNRKENNSGGKYEFSKAEITKLTSILMSLSTNISSSLKVSKQIYKK